ncbi:hypothetical protein EMIT0194P_20462 [Pseudomonas serbica]
MSVTPLKKGNNGAHANDLSFTCSEALLQVEQGTNEHMHRYTGPLRVHTAANPLKISICAVSQLSLYEGKQP